MSSQVEAAKKGWKFRYDARFTAPLFITVLLVAGHLWFGFLETYWQTLLAIGTAIVAELALSRLLRGQWPHLASAYISGISVGILIRSPLYWPFALAALITITSKYVLRYKGRHLWNPSNFGICAMLFLAPYAVAHLSVQWGNDLWPMLVIWVLGALIIARLKRFHICATYVAGFLLFAFLRTWFTGDSFLTEVAPITGPMYQLFVFFMITDPKTTVSSKRGQIAVAFAVALVETLFRLGPEIYPLIAGASAVPDSIIRLGIHAPFYALFIVGPIALLIEMKLKERARAGAVLVTGGPA